MSTIVINLLVFTLLIVLIVPYAAVACLRVILRQYGFRASVGGPKTFTRLCFKYTVKMNFQVLVSVESVRFEFRFPRSLTQLNDFFNSQSPTGCLNIICHGLSINLLLKDDFETWGSQKIELLQIINQMREKLTRSGLLKTNLKQKQDEQSQQPSKSKIEQYRSVLLNLIVQFYETECNFYVYKLTQDAQDLDAGNLREFNAQHLQNCKFREKYLCSTLQAPQGTLQISKIQDEHFDVDIRMQRLVLTHPLYRHKKGVLTAVDLNFKVPTSPKLAKDFCNYEMRIQIQEGFLNLNKKFLQNFLNFFVYFDALLSVIKGVRKLVLRQHYQDMLMYSFIKQGRQNEQPIFANYRDTVIPMRLQIQIQDGLHIMVSDPSKQLKPFVKGSDQVSEMFYARLQKRSIFEMTKTLKDSYYLNFTCDRIEVDINQEPAVRATNFVQELNLTFMREVTTLPVKLGRMFIEQLIKFQRLNVQMSPALLKVLYEVANFYHKSKHIASSKHRILGRLQDRNFLLTNIIANQNTEIRLSEEQILEIYEQPKHQDRFSTTFKVAEITLIHCKQSSTHEVKAKTIRMEIKDLQWGHIIENGTSAQTFECSNLFVQPSNPKLLPLLHTSNFKHQKYVILPSSILNTALNPHKQLYKTTTAEQFNLTLNFEVVLDHIDELLDYKFIQKVFSKKWQTKYNLQTILQESYKNAVTSFQFPRYADTKTVTRVNAFYFEEAMLLWYMSSKRLQSLSLTKFRPLSELPSAYDDYLGKELSQLVSQKVFKKFPVFCDEKGTITIEQAASTGQLIHRYEDILDDQLIMDSVDLEWHQKSTSEHQEFRFMFGRTNANLPYDYHFGSFINECIKQVAHTGNYIRRQYKSKKEVN